MSGGGSKLLNDPEIGEWAEFTTQTWHSSYDTLKKIDKPGLYYVGVDFMPSESGTGVTVKDVEARFGVQGWGQNLNTTEILNGTMFSASLGSIYYLPKDFEIGARIYTAAAGIKYRARYVLVCLRDDSQDA